MDTSKEYALNGPETEGHGFSGLISGRVIKWIALISMLCDHFAKITLPALIRHPWTSDAASALFCSDGIFTFQYALTCFGRLAFPLFIYLLVEGFFLTRSRPRYLCRIFLFALLSEVPFDLGFSRISVMESPARIFEFGYQNVLFTLSIGLAAMILIEMILKRFGTASPMSALSALIAIGAIWLGNLLSTDYHGFGVAAILIAYAVRRYFHTRGTYDQTKSAIPVIPVRTIEMALLILPLAALSPTECWAFLDVVLIALYSGKRGRKMHKWFFYAFYPAHLALLVLLRELL